jgi:hypothetical protein
MTTRFLALAALLFCLFLSPLPARAAGSVRLTISPNVLLADGISTASVTAEVRTSSGRPARDGTEVRFYTTAGSITQIAFTSAGVARATLTSSAVPQAANVSASAGLDQARITIPMVSKLVEASVGGRVMEIRGDYVAFSEDQKYIQADKQVRVRFRGVQIEADSVQIDINADTLIALGKINVSSGDKTLVGERLWLNLRTFEGYILAVGVKQWFSAYGLSELPERPKTANPTFELVDFTESKLIWVGKQANYILDERVQVQGARAYVGGVKAFRMPFHESNLQGGSPTDRYIGIGSEGFNIDLPLYLRMTPGSSTAVHLGYGDRQQGIGYFNQSRGLNVDLVQKYGFAGASTGTASFTNIASFSHWGFSWNHNQQINKTTRIAADFQFPEHRALWGALNLSSGLPFGTVNMAVSASKFERTSLAKTLQFGFESKPKPVLDGKLAVSVETSFFRRDPTTIRQDLTDQGLPGVRRELKLPGTQYQMAGLKFRPKSVELGKGFRLDSSAALRAVIGGLNQGFGPAFDAQVQKTLKGDGSLSFGLNYNQLAQISDIFPDTGRLNGTFTLFYPVTEKLRISAFGTMAFDAPSRSSLVQLSYQVAPKWRIEALHSLFKGGGFDDTDYQLGIVREIAGRDLAIYWSHREHRFLFEFGAGRF